jgi:hypothetical protein
MVEHDGDQIEPLEDEETSVIALLGTLGVLAATILATVAATLAALAAYNENLANRERQLWGTYALALDVQVQTNAASKQQLTTTRSIARWRAIFAESLAQQAPTLPGLQLAVLNDVLGANAAASSVLSSSPTPQGPPDRTRCHTFPQKQLVLGDVGSKSDCAAEYAAAYGRSAEDYLRNERAYLAIVSALAIALFLFALSRTLLLGSMQVMFLCVATAIVAITVGIGVFETFWVRSAQPDPRAITAYEHGHFARAVAFDPDSPDAWNQLAVDDSYNNHCAKSEADYSRAIELQPISINENDLASQEIECKHLRAAAHELQLALGDRTDDWAEGSKAELLLAEDHPQKAFLRLYDAVVSMEGFARGSQGLRGAAYSDLWFRSLLDDQYWLVPEYAKYGARQFIDEVWGLQATLYEALSNLPRPTPVSTTAVIDTVTSHQAPVATLASPTGNGSPTPFTAPSGLRPARAGAFASPVTVTLRYTGLQAGNVVALMWYDENNSVLTVPQTFEVVGKAGAPAPGSGTWTTPGWIFAPKGTYQLVAVLDSTYENSESVTVTGT